MRFIDTHFHLDLVESPEQLLNSIEREKIFTIAVTNAPSVFYFTKSLTKKSKYVRAGLGLHPELVKTHFNEIDQFIELLNETRYIGEIGLDFFKCSNSEKELQLMVFKQIIDNCHLAKNKILTIHSRRAEKHVVEIIGDNFHGTAILHWYSGGISVLKKALDNGCYFSINYPMTKSKSGQKIIQNIPLNRLLTESDGPFTVISGKSFTPIDLNVIVSEVANLKNETEVNVKKIIYNNFCRILEKSYN